VRHSIERLSKSRPNIYSIETPTYASQQISSSTSKKIAVRPTKFFRESENNFQTDLKRKSLAEISAISPNECSMVNLKDISFGGTHSRILPITKQPSFANLEG
jgi:hypothetical protein